MSYQMINIVYYIYEILQNIFSAVILCTLTGSLFYIFWIPFSKRIELEGNPKQAYFILKIIILSYLFPLMYFIVKQNDGYDIFWGATYPLQVGMILISVVWIVGFIRKLGKYFQEHKKMKRMMKSCHICRRNVAAIARKCVEEAGYQREIKIYQGDWIPVPMAYGIVNPTILLPDIVYTKNQLEVMLLHELEHCKHHDLFWIYLNNIVTCVHWFNPVVKVIGRQLDLWSEIYCDLYVLNITSSIKQYYGEVIQMSAKFSSQRTYLACALFENMTELERRMKRVIRIQKNGKCSLRIATLCVVMFCLLSTASVSAATIGYYKGYKGIKDAMTEEVEVPADKEVILKEKYQERPDMIRWNDTKKKFFEKEDVQVFNWTIKSNEGNVTDFFYARKGEKIRIETLIAQEDDFVADMGELRMGIVNEEGRQRYVTERNSMTGIFKINKSGNYRLFAENLSKWTIQFGGFVKKEK